MVTSTSQSDIECYCLLESLLNMFIWGKRLTSTLGFNLSLHLGIWSLSLPREVCHVSTHFIYVEYPLCFPNNSVFFTLITQAFAKLI